MSVELVGFIGILLMFVLIFLRVPIALSMVIPALLGILYLKGWKVFYTAVETIVWGQSFNYTMSTIPMFVLMGELLFAAGISGELFNTFRAWFGRLRGGLGIATVTSSAVFAAASGSSLATTATIGVVASKEMLKSNYNESFTAGSILAGGTLGILIPPSTTLIIYGMLTEQSIGQLLIAGILPGILLTMLYILTIMITVRINPRLAPKVNVKSSWKEKFISLKSTIWIILLFILVIGGMYAGIFNPTEAAGIGAFLTFLIALMKRKLTVKKLIEAMNNTLRTTGFLFAIIIMAFILNYFLTLTRIPILMANFFDGLNLPPFFMFMAIIFMYILLGAVMDALAMIVVTIPIVLPIIQALGFDLIWFGIIVIMVVEMAMISPPVGMSSYVLKGSTEGLTLEQIFKGALLFLIPIFVAIIILYFFPEIATFLPSQMYR